MMHTATTARTIASSALIKGYSITVGSGSSGVGSPGVGSSGVGSLSVGYVGSCARNLARLHRNPRLGQIHFHTFRHCKALREYHKIKSIQYVKRILGHKSIMTTQQYVDLYRNLRKSRTHRLHMQNSNDTKRSETTHRIWI